jgi:hypothetical protein
LVVAERRGVERAGAPARQRAVSRHGRKNRAATPKGKAKDLRGKTLLMTWKIGRHRRTKRRAMDIVRRKAGMAPT